MRENEKVTTILRQRADEVSAAADLLVSKTRDWQVIKQYLSNRANELDLTRDQKKKLERYQYIYNQLVSGKYTKTEIINQVRNLYKVSLCQVYDDLSCTQEIFSTVVNINKLFELQIELESCRAMKRKCIEANDMNAAARHEKNIISIMALLPDDELSPGEDFEGHFIEAVFDPELLGAPKIDMKEVLTAINAKRKVKINTDMFDDINFTYPDDGSS